MCSCNPNPNFIKSGIYSIFITVFENFTFILFNTKSKYYVINTHTFVGTLIKFLKNY